MVQVSHKIYTLIDPTTKDIRYIGQTNNLKRRLVEHRKEGKNCINGNLKNNWIKSLLDKNLNPTIKEIDSTSEDKINKLEKYYVALYISKGHNLLNSQDGGFRSKLIDKSNVIIANRINSIKYKKIVLQYNLEGNFLKEHPSLLEAANYLGVLKTKISSCCNNHRKSAYGYMWIHKKGRIKNKISPYHSHSVDHSTKKVNKLDVDENLLYTYNSIADAARDVSNIGKKAASNIQACIRGKQKTAYGFLWQLPITT